MDPSLCRQLRRRAFSLVEAAVVLGVVGLVIGGLWAAASDVRQRLHLQHTAGSAISIVFAARALLPFQTYPTTDNTWSSITAMLNAAGVLPRGYRCCNGVYAAAPSGLYLNISQICYSAFGCPTLGVSLGYSYGSDEPTLSRAECEILLKSFAATAKDQITGIQFVNFSAGINVWLPTASLNSGSSCPANVNLMYLYFRP